MVAQQFRTGAWGRNLGANLVTPADWILPGYFAQGRVTMLTSLWKSGKTTLISLLLARRGISAADAGSVGYDSASEPVATDANCVGNDAVADAASVGSCAQLAGRPVQPGQSIVLSEEDESIWAERSKRLDLGNVFFYCQPFDGKPTQAAWCAFLHNLVEKKPADNANFLVVDTLASFLPGRNENNAAVMMEALAPLRLLTRHGFAVALLHHPRKGDPLPGQAARGSGALSGFVDIFLEMSQPPGYADSRRRIVRGYSRFQETPRQLLLELNDAGDDYLVLEVDDNEDDFRQYWDVLRMVLDDARRPLNCRQILDDWPDDYPKPADRTLFRWMAKAVQLGLVRQEGTGRKGDAYRYWLPGAEKKWEDDPIYQLENQNRDFIRRLERGEPVRKEEWKSDWPPTVRTRCL